jgi:PAS domain S-box-containing protein
MNDNGKTKEQLVHELTELRLQNAALKKSMIGSISAELVTGEALQYAESILETVREPLLVLDADLKIISANSNFYSTFKVTPAETIGSFIYDLGNRQWNIPKLRDLLENILPEKTTFDDYEVEHNFTTIGRRVMLLNARQIKRVLGKEKIILLAIEDITESKRLEDELMESEERFRRLFETANDAIVLLEKGEGKITHSNPAAEKMLGYTKKESIGHSLQEIGILLDMDDFQTTMQELNRIGILNYDDVPVKTKSGNHIYTDIYIVDRSKLVQCNIRDITEGKEAENELHRQLEELQRWYAVTVDREERNLELKMEVNALLKEAGRPARYGGERG